MSAETFASIVAWATIYQWLAIALVFVYDSGRMHRRTIRQYRLALNIGNGKIISAKRRRRISFWFLVGSTLALFLGGLGVFSNAFMEPPPPDTRIVGAVIREGIVVMLFSFWRAKREHVIQQREIDEMTESDLLSVAQDTNERVRKIQSKQED